MRFEVVDEDVVWNCDDFLLMIGFQLKLGLLCPLLLGVIEFEEGSGWGLVGFDELDSILDGELHARFNDLNRYIIGILLIIYRNFEDVK